MTKKYFIVAQGKRISFKIKNHNTNYTPDSCRDYTNLCSLSYYTNPQILNEILFL